MNDQSSDKAVRRITDHLAAQRPGHPLRVAVDGITASGKTTLARELAEALRAQGRPAIHLSMDGFHHPRAHRHRQGRDSALGYYQDAYDFDSFARLVLTPLGPGGDHRYRTRIIDLPTDQSIHEDPVQAPEDAALIVDGSFLQRELTGLWDQVVFVDTAFEIARERGTRRDTELLGGLEQARRAFDQRYHAASRMYLDQIDPAARADIVVGNDDVKLRILRRIGGPATGSVKLFAYGTLQQPQVQLSRFGRLLHGTPDILPGYSTNWVTIADPDVIAAGGSDRHPVVRRTGESHDSVPGTVFTLSPVELAAADHYEVDDYRRVLARLGSGTDAWVYLAAERTGASED